MNLYAFGRSLFNGIFKGGYRVEVIGVENVPKDSGVLICSNHISNLDPPLVGTTANNRTVHFMAKSELFDFPILKQVLPRVNAFPVKRGMSDKQALRKGLQLLRDGKAVGLFPEGTRTRTGKVGQGLAGAGFFALKTDAKVVPCAIIGPIKLFHKFKIVYGKPIDLTELKERKASAKEATEKIMNEIQQLYDDNK
ncbi:1-acyl-sn-glycerol-3-phosphate acyltransferase [Alkalihalobacillus sp. AL-G]|uniref:lysophospholipid acyltransferase family protein n=1 Tax=Alkalihalobacillus sp. AL-G TaxID=2926399 RepID=UPI00272AF153|nr:lysophospholipid acyltransferase family protein [Alkalihalobacillus sp. AL-G]WLD91844.1 1-acyl-sn-glycerol-3-phosphate acyltransferase [Alkalihalobacillus sp. AL-G]